MGKNEGEAAVEGYIEMSRTDGRSEEVGHVPDEDARAG